jgi:hypothetical protein
MLGASSASSIESRCSAGSGAIALTAGAHFPKQKARMVIPPELGYGKKGMPPKVPTAPDRRAPPGTSAAPRACGDSAASADPKERDARL